MRIKANQPPHTPFRTPTHSATHAPSTSPPPLPFHLTALSTRFHSTHILYSHTHINHTATLNKQKRNAPLSALLLFYFYIESRTAHAKMNKRPLKLPQAIWLATTMQALCPKAKQRPPYRGAETPQPQARPANKFACPPVLARASVPAPRLLSYIFRSFLKKVKKLIFYCFNLNFTNLHFLF